MPAIRIDSTSSTANPMPGNRTLRSQTLARTPSARMIASQNRIVFAGSTEWTSYSDVHSVLPAKTILFWLAIILALGVLASVWLRSVLLPGIGFAVLLVLSILIAGIYPAIVQQVSVKP